MKKYLLLTLSLLLLIVGGCKATGPAQDKWDEEEAEDKIDLGAIFKRGDKKTEKENEALKQRIEALERAQSSQESAPAAPVQEPSAPVQEPSAPVQEPSAPVQEPSAPAKQPTAPVPASEQTPASDITAPPSIGAQTRSEPQLPDNGSISYQQWLRAKQSNTEEYQDFKEYQEWLEFKKQQQQP